MKPGWRTKQLGEVAEIISGQSPPGSFYNTSGHGLPFYQGKKEFGQKFIGPPTTWTSQITKVALEGDVLMSVRAPVGPVNFAIQKSCIGRGLAAIRSSKDLHKDFLFYFLLSKQDEIIGSEGAVFASINKNDIQGLEIPLPSLPEQERIAGILDEVFDGIATAKADAEKNLRSARSLLDSYLESIFTQRGEGRVEKKLSEICAITSTLVDPRESKFLDLVHVGAGNIESQTGVLLDLMSAREAGLISGKFLFDDSMILYSKIRPYLMKVARPDFSGLCSADVYPLAPLSDQVDRDYLFHLLLSNAFTEYAIQGSARAGMPKVNREYLFEFRVWLPSVQNQKAIARTLDNFREETRRLESIYRQKLSYLAELEQSILRKAFAGELTKESLKSTTVVFPKTIPNIASIDLHAGILAIAYQKHERHFRQSTFGHVKAEKIAHMVEAHVGIDLGRSPVKDAAGPNDYRHLRRVEHRAEKAGYFSFKQNGAESYIFRKLGSFDKLVQRTRDVLASDNRAVDAIIDSIVPMKTQQAEILATVFAAWNNLLIDGRDASNEAIVSEARENWHHDKLEIPRDNFFKAIDWMKKKNIVPIGRGKKVIGRDDA